MADQSVEFSERGELSIWRHGQLRPGLPASRSLAQAMVTRGQARRLALQLLAFGEGVGLDLGRFERRGSRKAGEDGG